ncbi:hypothetical protein ACWDAZ_06095 [Streptomyces sp. NPDC001215]
MPLQFFLIVVKPSLKPFLYWALASLDSLDPLDFGVLPQFTFPSALLEAE